MKCSPLVPAPLFFQLHDQPEVAELYGDEASQQWLLAQRLAEARPSGMQLTPVELDFEDTQPMVHM